MSDSRTHFSSLPVAVFLFMVSVPVVSKRSSKWWRKGAYHVWGIKWLRVKAARRCWNVLVLQIQMVTSANRLLSAEMEPTLRKAGGGQGGGRGKERGSGQGDGDQDPSDG